MKQPIRRSLIRPPLILGMPRNPGIMLICTCLMLGFQFGHWIAALVLFAVVWSVLALIVQVDYRLPQIFVRSLWRSPGSHLRK